MKLHLTRMTLQTKTVVAETFVHLRQCLAEIETEIIARALRLSSLSEEANDVKDVPEELPLVQGTRHSPSC